MRMKFLIIPIIFILTAVMASAADFSIIETEAINDEVFLNDENAVFDLTIFNSLSTDDVLSFTIYDPEWSLLKGQFNIPANTQKTIRLEIRPSRTIPFQHYQFPVKIKSSRTDEFIEYPLQVYVKPFDPVFGEYRPSVVFGVTIDKEVDPRKKVAVEIYMRNRNALDITNLEIMIDGELFSENIQTTLGPLDERRIEYLFDIDPLTKAGLYSLNAQIISKNVSLSTEIKSYEVMPYASITMDSKEKSFLFKKTETITLENLGNAESIKTVNLRMSWTKRLFSSSEPESVTVNVDGKSSLQWEIEIGPQEYEEIVVSTNYRVPIIILLTIVAIIILYFQLRSPLIVSKEVIITGVADEGVEHLKIRLFVKNRSGKTIERVNVFDRIPGIAELIKKKVLGTIEPEKVTKQEKKGTIVKWNLETLEPFEERIITYELQSKLKIIGNISLPSTRVTFLDKNKERRVYSQRIIVSN